MEKGLNKKGLSAVVTTLLFILLAIGAVLLVWGLVRTQISRGSSQVESTSACFSLDLEPVTCAIAGTNATVTYKRSTGDANGMELSTVKLVFELADGTSRVEDESTQVPGILETKSKTVLAFSATNLPAKFSVAGLLLDSEGVERICTESTIVVNCN